MSLTALNLSPEALKQYHPREAARRRRAETRVEVSRRRRRALAAAHKAAELLKSEFGASEVILFGSLTRRGSFTLFSDIDLAARGIPSDRYLAAMETVLYLNAEFKIDLAEIETCPPAVLKNIEKDGRPL
jgi:predicted nucleotidyltransferase